MIRGGKKTNRNTEICIFLLSSSRMKLIMHKEYREKEKNYTHVKITKATS